MMTLIGTLIFILALAIFLIVPYVIGCLIFNEKPFNGDEFFGLYWVAGNFALAILIGVIYIGNQIGNLL
jgi:uncharacterized protein YqhQ